MFLVNLPTKFHFAVVSLYILSAYSMYWLHIGLPVLRLDTCSDSEIHFTCTVDQTELQWEIDFSRGPKISDIFIRYFSSDAIIGSRRDIITNRATAYTFYLTSASPLTSTMTTNTSTDLYGATVTCQDGFTNATFKDKIILHGEAIICMISCRLTVLPYALQR